MELFIICAIIGCIPAAIAKSKGHSFLGWWIYGALLFIIALIHSLVIKRDIRAIEQSQLDEGLAKCPFCAEMIKPDAIKCKHCGSCVKDAMQSAILKNFQPSDMPFDSFFVKVNEGRFAIDKDSIATLVVRLKQANPGMHPMNIKEKYRSQIEDLKNWLPSEVREEFLRFYDAKF